MALRPRNTHSPARTGAPGHTEEPPPEDPVEFQRNAANIVIFESDATAVWLKARGEEGIVVQAHEGHGPAERRRLRHFARACKDEQLQEMSHQMAEGCYDLAPQSKSQVDFQAQSGGDKARLTMV